MGLPLYLAMTEQEIDGLPLPERLAYMACHFAPYGKGLCHIPQALPGGSMLILNDRVPVWQHDPQLIARQLQEAVEKLSCSHLLLDFQRPFDPQADKILKAIVSILSCPVGVSETYAGDTDCAVFLSAPKVNKTLSSHLAPWKARKIWLEAATESSIFTVTPEGTCEEAAPEITLKGTVHLDERLICRYTTEVSSSKARFTLCRAREDVVALLTAAEEMGVELAVGLHQQLSSL